MCFENIPYKATYSVKIGVWNDSKTMWDSLQTLALMQKTCLIYIFGILYACARSCLRAQADSCIHIARVSLALFFQKQIYLLIKSYIFHFNISQINLTSNWALNQP